MVFKKNRKNGIHYFGYLMLMVLLISAIFYVRMLTGGGDQSGPKKIPVQSQVKILDDFERHGIWKVDRQNHRCLIEGGVWAQFPLERKEQCLQAIYMEQGTWWEIYDRMSGKLLGKVSSWGWKIYP